MLIKHIVERRKPQSHRPAAAIAVTLIVAFASGPVHAQDSSQAGAALSAGGASSGKSDDGAARPPWEGDLATRSALLGDLAGLRSTLDQYGVSFGLTETAEVFGNASGGVKRGAIVEGLTQFSVGVDTGKAFGLSGGIFNVSGFQIHGRGLTTQNVQNIDVVSSIEARPTTRLNELWFEQSFWGGKADIRIGQQSADLEFITSEYEDLFINSSFGWPTLPAVDLPSGGAAYPLATPGVRLRLRPTEQITTLFGVYSGSPAGLKPGDPQVNNPSGTNFDLSSGAFLIAEVQYALNREKDAVGLPGTYKLGAWYNTNRFADALYQSGPSAQPPGVIVGVPRFLRGDWSVYATFDQLVYRVNDGGSDGLGLTARVMGAPTDRNLIDLFAQGGVTYKGAFGRPNDTMGVGVAWSRIGARARAGDAIMASIPDSGVVVRSSETVVEVTYQAQVRPWWLVQVDFQYVINPGAGVLNPLNPIRQIGDAAIFGLRSTVTF